MAKTGEMNGLQYHRELARALRDFGRARDTARRKRHFSSGHFQLALRSNSNFRDDDPKWLCSHRPRDLAPPSDRLPRFGRIKTRQFPLLRPQCQRLQ